MSAAIPFIPVIAGAGIGAAMNEDNPVAGAALGALGGWAAGPALGAMGASVAEGGGLGGLLAAPSYAGLGGMGAQQAGMLAAQTGEFGTAGLGATGAAAGIAAPSVAQVLPPSLGTAAKTLPLMSMGMGMMAPKASTPSTINRDITSMGPMRQSGAAQQQQQQERFMDLMAKQQPSPYQALLGNPKYKYPGMPDPYGIQKLKMAGLI
jgi:type IV secretion system protein TrbL